MRLRIDALGTSESDRLCTNELGAEIRLAVFQQHLEDFDTVVMQLVKRCSLTMRARQPGIGRRRWRGARG